MNSHQRAFCVGRFLKFYAEANQAVFRVFSVATGETYLYFVSRLRSFISITPITASRKMVFDIFD